MADRNCAELLEPAASAPTPCHSAPLGYAPRPFMADPGLGLRWARPRNLTARFDRHSHPELLIGLTRAGCEDFVDAGRPGRALPGKVRILPPHVEHHGGAPPGIAWSYDVLYVPPALAGELAGLAPDAALPTPRSFLVDDPQLAAAIDSLFVALEAEEPMAVAERLSLVLGRIAEVHAVDRLAPVAAVRHRCLERARDMLHANVRTRVRLDALANAAGLSKFHLIRSFRAHTGLTPWQYQVRLRVELAKTALKAGAAPSRLAHELGFVDQSHFTRTFRGIVGTTPGAYADRA